MTRVEITDEMVAVIARGIAADRDCHARHAGVPCTVTVMCFCAKEARSRLEAALNPPPEEKIEVSEGMLAVADALRNDWPGSDARSWWVALYRAMERQCRREEAEARDARLRARP